MQPLALIRALFIRRRSDFSSRCLLLLSVALAACSPAAEPEPPLAPGCNPLGGGTAEDCLLPFPSSACGSAKTTCRPSTARCTRVWL